MVIFPEGISCRYLRSAISTNWRIASERFVFWKRAQASTCAMRPGDILTPINGNTPVAGRPGFRLTDIDFDMVPV
jgi:hypothetical protein